MSGESCHPSNCKRSAHSVWWDGEGIHTGKLALQTHRYGQGYPAATLTMNFGLTPARAGTTGREISGVLSRVTSPSGGPKVYGHCDLRLLHLDKTGKDGWSKAPGKRTVCTREGQFAFPEQVPGGAALQAMATVSCALVRRGLEVEVAIVAEGQGSSYERNCCGDEPGLVLGPSYMAM